MKKKLKKKTKEQPNWVNVFRAELNNVRARTNMLDSHIITMDSVLQQVMQSIHDMTARIDALEDMLIEEEETNEEGEK